MSVAPSVATSVAVEPSKKEIAYARQMGNPSTHDTSGKMPTRRDLELLPGGPSSGASARQAAALPAVPEMENNTTKTAEEMLREWQEDQPPQGLEDEPEMEVTVPLGDEPEREPEREPEAPREGGSLPPPDDGDNKTALVEVTRFHEGSVYGERGRERNPEEEKHDKISYLHDIDMLARELKVYNPPKRFGVEDDIDDIRFERDRLQLQVQARRGAQAFKGGIKFTAMFLEIMNDKVLRGAVPIKGLHQEICRDMKDGKYDSPLTRIYKKHFRRGTTSPEMELGLMMGNTVARVVGKNLIGKQGFKSFLEDTTDSGAPVQVMPNQADVPAAMTMEGPTGMHQPFEPARPVAPPPPPAAPAAGPTPNLQEENRLRAEFARLEKAREADRQQFAAQMNQMGRMAESLGDRHRALNKELTAERQKMQMMEEEHQRLRQSLEEARRRDQQALQRELQREREQLRAGQEEGHEDEPEDVVVEAEAAASPDATPPRGGTLEIYDDKKHKEKRKSPPLKLNM